MADDDPYKVLVYIPKEDFGIKKALTRIMEKKFGERVVVSSDLEGEVLKGDYPAIIDITPSIELNPKANVLDVLHTRIDTNTVLDYRSVYTQDSLYSRVIEEVNDILQL